MPDSRVLVGFGSGGSGGGGLDFRDAADIFTGADLTACRTARDAFFVASLTASALAEYQGNKFLTIILNPANSTDNVFETYLPGNEGKTYASAQWVARTSAIQGNPGPKGDTGTAVDATARSIAGSATLVASKAKADLAIEVTARTDADIALGNRIDAVPSGTGGGGTGGGGTGGVPFSPTLIFTADDVDLPNDQTTVAITLTAAWDSFDAFYFTASLRNADAINNLILKEDFQRIGVKAASGTNWYSGSEPSAIFVLDQNLQSGGVSGMAICRIADTTMLLLARSFNSSTINAQDIRIWGINFGAKGEKGDKGDKGDTGSGTADSTARDSIATEVTQRKQADTDEAIVRDAADVDIGTRISNEIDTRTTNDTALGGRIDGNVTKITAVKATADGNVTEIAAVKGTAEAAQTLSEVATSIGVETRAREAADAALTFTGLTDTPSAIVADKFVKSNAGGDALEYVDAPTPAVTFTDLTDTPSAIVADKFVKSNAGGDALEYVDAPSIAGLSAEVTARKAGDATEATARKAGDAALGIRIDALAVSGSGGGLTETILFDGDVAGSTNNILRPLYQGASPAVVDKIVVPETGDLLFTVYPKTTNAFAGHFQIAAEDFILRTGAVTALSGQGQNTGFAFPIGQNRAFVVTHRVVGGVKRFLWATSHDANLTWHLEITHLTPAPPVDPPAPNYKPGPTPHTFSGANRAGAIAALDKYLDGVSVVTQASVRIVSDADNYITVSMHPDVAVGPKGNKWSLVWGGDSPSAGVESVETFDRLFRAVVQWDSGAATLEDLHSLFHGDSKFESVVTGDDASLASISETFGGDVVGNTIFFQGGNRVHIETPHSWFSHYVDNPAATVTLEYESRQEMQVWDATAIDFKTAFILLDSPTKPNPWTVLTHPNISTENWQWTLSATGDEQELKERSGGTVKLPTSPSDTDAVQLAIPTDSKEVYVRLTNGDETDAAYIPMIIIAPDNAVVEPHVSLVLSYTTMILRISLSGHVYVKRAISGTTVVGCDIWYR